MAPTPEIDTVESGDDYYHVRFRDPDEFEEIRTPDWAAEVARSVSEGSEVRMGRRADGDDWEVQSVLVRKEAGEETAREAAVQITEKIES